MARRPVPNTRQFFDALTVGIGEMLHVYEQVAEGRIADLSDFPETVFGPVANDLRVDWAQMEFYVTNEWDIGSAAVLDNLQKSMEIETHVAGLMEAAARVHADTGVDFLYRTHDHTEAKKRLTKLADLFDTYREDETDGMVANPVTQQIAHNRFGINRGFREELMELVDMDEAERNETYAEARRELLDESAMHALNAGLSFLHAARLTLAQEVLRLEIRDNPAQPLYEDDKFLSALAGAKRNLDRADLMRHNAWYAMPDHDDEFEPLVPDNDEDDNDGGTNGNGGETPPPRNRMN